MSAGRGRRWSLWSAADHRQGPLTRSLGLLVQLANVVVEIGAVGHRVGGAALLVAANHANDRAGAGFQVEIGDPGAAAGAAEEAAALELDLVRALLAGLVLAGHR